MGKNRKLLAVMFTDIVGYTTMSSSDEKDTLELVESTNRLLKVYVRIFRGQWLKQVGDGTLTTFESALDAVLCAVNIQQTFSANHKVQLRVGIHIGDVVQKDGDVWGDGVNIASRTEGKAPAGGIAVTSLVKEALVAHPELPFEFLESCEFKGAGREIDVFTLPLHKVRLRPHQQSDVEKLPDKPKRLVSKPIAVAIGIAVFVLLALIYGLNPTSSGDRADFALSVETAEGQAPDTSLVWMLDEARYNLSGLLSDTTQFDPADLEQANNRLQAIVETRDNQVFINWKASAKDNLPGRLLLDKMYTRNDMYTAAQDIVQRYVRYLTQTNTTEKFRVHPDAASLYIEAKREFEDSFTTAKADSILNLLNSALTLEPDFDLAMAMKCNVLVNLNRYFNDPSERYLQQAEPVCLSLLNMQTSRAEVAVAIAHYYMESDQIDSAIMFLEKSGFKSLEWYLANTLMLAKQGKMTNAISHLDHVSQTLGFDHWRILFRKASLFVWMGDCVNAAATYEQILLEKPDVYDAQLNLASCYFQMGELELARKVFARINAINPTSYTLSNHGTTQYYAGLYEKAADSFRAALQAAPNDHEIHGNLGDALLEISDQQEQAKDSFKAAIRLAQQQLNNTVENDDPFLFLWLAHYSSQLENFEQADLYFDLYSQQAEQDADYHYYLAISLVKRGDSMNARKHIEAAMQLSYPVAYIDKTPSLALVRKSQPNDVMEP